MVKNITELETIDFNEFKEVYSNFVKRICDKVINHVGEGIHTFE